MLRRIFGPKRDDVKREGKNYIMRRSVICTYPSNVIRVIESRRMRWAGLVVPMGECRGVYIVLVESPEGKRPLGRPRLR